MAKQGNSDGENSISQSLTLSEFTDQILAYGLNESGDLDLNKLSVDVVESLEKPRLYEDFADLDQLQEVNVRTILLMVIAGLLIIIIILGICVCRLRQSNLNLIRESKHQRVPTSVTLQTEPPKEGDILDSEASNLGNLQATELPEVKGPKQLTLKLTPTSSNNFGPRGFNNSPQFMGRHAHK